MLGVQKKLAAKVLGCSPKRVVFDVEHLGEIKEAITKADLRALISQGLIIMLPTRGVSRSRAHINASQKRKNRRKGAGSKKGKAGSRTDRKSVWVSKVRLQRLYLKGLKAQDKLAAHDFAELYRKAKGGFFRSKRHLELYITERGMLK